MEVLDHQALGVILGLPVTDVQWAPDKLVAVKGDQSDKIGRLTWSTTGRCGTRC